MTIRDVRSLPVWGGERLGRNYFFVVVETDEGVSGVGEAGLTMREQAVAGAVEHLKGLLVGQDPFRTEHLWQSMFRGGFFPAQRVVASAISAIDIALWDIKGKALGLPVYQLLGGRVRDKVVCYPHVGGSGGSKAALVDAALAAKAAGWRFVRFGLPGEGDVLEPGRAARATIGLFHAVREAVGDDVEVCVDLHTRLDMPEALLVCREIESARPYFVEDPLRAENPDSYATLRPRTAAPLAAGEHFSSKWEFRQLIEQELIDYARIDLCIAGGFTEGRKIAGWCETHGIRLALHNPLGPVSTAACLAMNLATPNFGVQEQPRKPGEILPDVFPVQPEWRDGHLWPSDRPGLGLELDEAAARRQPLRAAQFPQWRREDGSVTNW